MPERVEDHLDLTIDLSPRAIMSPVLVEALTYRALKGFAPCTWETLPARMCSLAVEIDELADAISHFRNEPSAFGQMRDEFADVALYTLTMLHDLAGADWTLRERYHGARTSACADRAVRPIRAHWSRAIRAWQFSKPRDAVIALELLLAATANLSARLLPQQRSAPNHYEALAAACFQKLLAMAFRPMTHGGKRPES